MLTSGAVEANYGMLLAGKEFRYPGSEYTLVVDFCIV